jgi:CHASE3 domain sensor protein
MKTQIDILQNKKIDFLFGAVAFIAGVATIVVFIQNSKTKKEKRAIIDMEVEIKQLELAKLRAEKKRGLY